MDSDSDALFNSGRFMAFSRAVRQETPCDEKGLCAGFPRQQIHERPHEHERGVGV